MLHLTSMSSDCLEALRVHAMIRLEVIFVMAANSRIVILYEAVTIYALTDVKRYFFCGIQRVRLHTPRKAPFKLLRRRSRAGTGYGIAVTYNGFGRRRASYSSREAGSFRAITSGYLR